MRQHIIKVILFAATLFLSLNIISAIMNMGNTDMTVEMDEASYPTVSVYVDGHSVNTMHGYSGEMEANYLRDSLTPLPEDRRLFVKVNLFGEKITAMGYEVRSLDTTRLVEDTQVYDYVHQEDEIDAVFGIKDLIDKNQEYILVTKITLEDGEEVRYYTRIISNDNINSLPMLEYVRNFHDKTFDKEQAKSLVTYLESNEEGDNSTYQHVDIHSSFNQVTWGDLNITNVSDLQTTILEMDSTNASIRLDYRVEIKEGKKTEEYRVSEFFRIRYTEERTYLLDYQRYMNQVFDPEEEVFVNDKILLGIVDNNVQYDESNDGSIIVFVLGNALYEYRNNEGILAKIFSFYDSDNLDVRTMYDRNKIKVMNVDEAGNVLFMVYGYMNRGRHEGRVGVCVYYYDNALNSIEEKVYIPYNRSFGILDQNLSKLSYVNRKNELFLYIGDDIYCIRLDENSGQIQVKGLAIDKLVTSASNEMVAWEESDNSAINLMDLSSGKVRRVEDEAGGRVHALGFLGEDFVYGVSEDSSGLKDAMGIAMTLMHTVIIEDKNGTNLKTYNESGTYVTGAVMTDSSIQMNRVRYDSQSGQYYIINDDQIMSSQTDKSTKNTLTTVITENREKVVEIALTGNVPGSIHMQTPKEVIIEGTRTFSLENDRDERSQYYVYAGGEICGIYTKPYQAVNKAAAVSGVVVNNGQEYIWQKGNRRTRNEIRQIEIDEKKESETSLAVCLDAILDYEGTPRNSQYELNHGETAMSLLKSNIDGEILDLSGCELKSVLYYVSQDCPVLATGEQGESVLIIGYDEKNTILADPMTGTIYRMGMIDSTETFSDHGNEFITYVRNRN